MCANPLGLATLFLAAAPFHIVGNTIKLKQTLKKSEKKKERKKAERKINIWKGISHFLIGEKLSRPTVKVCSEINRERQMRMWRPRDSIFIILVIVVMLKEDKLR